VSEAYAKKKTLSEVIKLPIKMLGAI